MRKGVFASGADDDAKEGELGAVETHDEDARLNEVSNQLALVAGLVAHAGVHARLLFCSCWSALSRGARSR